MPFDSWMWPCRPTAGCTDWIASRTAELPAPKSTGAPPLITGAGGHTLSSSSAQVSSPESIGGTWKLKTHRDGTRSVYVRDPAGEEGPLTLDPEDHLVALGKAQRITNRFWDGDLTFRGHSCGYIHSGPPYSLDKVRKAASGGGACPRLSHDVTSAG